MKRIPDKTSPIHSKIRRFLLYWEHQGERRQRQVEQQKGSGKDKNIHSGHRQRIRDRFLKTGLDGFQDHKHKFVGRTNEVVYLACLDNKKKLLYCDILTEGTIDSAPITVRRIVEVAMRVAAASVVVAHNHPQGFALPSNDDIATTIKLRNALDAVSVQLLDHIIVAQDDFVSLADSGLFVGM